LYCELKIITKFKSELRNFFTNQDIIRLNFETLAKIKGGENICVQENLFGMIFGTGLPEDIPKNEIARK